MKTINTLEEITQKLEKLNIKPDTKEYFNELGLICESKGSLKEAADFFHKALTIDPGFKYALFNQANVLIKLNFIHEGMDFLEKAINIDPNFVEAIYNKGVQLQKYGKLDEALECYLKINQIKPDFLLAYWQMVIAYYNLKEYKPCSEYADIYLKEDYENHEVWFFKGLALNYLGKYQESLSCLDTAITLKADYIEAIAAKGFVFGNINDLENEINCYNVLLSIDPTNKVAWVNKSNALIKIGMFEEALKSADIALSIDPTSKEALINKKTAQQRLGV